MHMHVPYIPYIPCKKSARQALKKVHNQICERLLGKFSRADFECFNLILISTYISCISRSISVSPFLFIYVHRNCAWIKWKVALNAHAPTHTHLLTHAHTHTHELARSHAHTCRLMTKFPLSTWGANGNGKWCPSPTPFLSLLCVPTCICVWCGTL